MNSATTKRFWKCFDGLPETIQRQAVKAFAQWKANPTHPGLHFKEVRGFDGVYSVRIAENWRAVGRRKSDTIYWFWIGSHADYNRLLRNR